MRVEFSNDELILTLVSLIRVIDPKLLRQGPDGFAIDFESLEGKASLNSDERLLIRLRGALDMTGDQSSYGLELSLPERQRLAETLDRLEHLQDWPADVVELSNELQARLLAGK